MIKVQQVKNWRKKISKMNQTGCLFHLRFCLSTHGFALFNRNMRHYIWNLLSRCHGNACHADSRPLPHALQHMHTFTRTAVMRDPETGSLPGQCAHTHTHRQTHTFPHALEHSEHTNTRETSKPMIQTAAQTGLLCRSPAFSISGSIWWRDFHIERKSPLSEELNWTEICLMEDKKTSSICLNFLNKRSDILLWSWALWSFFPLILQCLPLLPLPPHHDPFVIHTLKCTHFLFSLFLCWLLSLQWVSH